MFIAALSQQLKCVTNSVEWINKMWYLYTMEYYSALKRKVILTYATMWMNIESIMLSEVRQSKKGKYHANPLLWGTESSQNHRDRKKNGGFQWLGEGYHGELLYRWYWVSVLQDETSFGDEWFDGCRTLWIYLMPLNCMLKMVKMVKFVTSIFKATAYIN